MLVDGTSTTVVHRLIAEMRSVEKHSSRKMDIMPGIAPIPKTHESTTTEHEHRIKALEQRVESLEKQIEEVSTENTVKTVVDRMRRQVGSD